MHLRDLRKEGIVSYKADLHDNRKKIFYLNSEYLGSIDSNRIKLAKKNQTKLMVDEFIQNGEIEYLILLTHTFKSLLFEFGMDISPILQKVGNHVGEYLYEQLRMMILIFTLKTFQDTGMKTILENCHSILKTILR